MPTRLPALSRLQAQHAAGPHLHAKPSTHSPNCHQTTHTPPIHHLSANPPTCQ